MPLEFEIVAECSTTKARSSIMHLKHYSASCPMFMPVGTQGTMKGLTSQQLQELDCHVILGNTYHLGLRPGMELFNDVKGLHNFMNWPRGLLTDSGGFQMVSLLKLSQLTEEGVQFFSPFDGSPMLLTPEKSIEIQNAIGADIIMQLDDVVAPTVEEARLEEAMYRSIRWLDRCITAHQNPQDQNLFPIIQGGLNLKWRAKCVDEMVKRQCPGYAIGGLSGGEDKDQFWRIVNHCTDLLPNQKPRYCMGVGYAEDLVVCAALGVDMFDCVFPTRTARFGNALTRRGPISLKSRKTLDNMDKLEQDCECFTCRQYTKAYVSQLFMAKETLGCHLITIHNIAFQMRLMKDIRESIEKDIFPTFIQTFMYDFFKNREDPIDEDLYKGQELVDGYPEWIVNALASVNVFLL